MPWSPNRCVFSNHLNSPRLSLFRQSYLDVKLTDYGFTKVHIFHLPCLTSFLRYSPRMGLGRPLSPLSLHLLVFCSVLLVPFLDGCNYFLLLSIPFLSTRIVPLRFQARGRSKRPNLGIVCCVYFALSVFLS